jgi:hypothetical protein
LQLLLIKKPHSCNYGWFTFSAPSAAALLARFTSRLRQHFISRLLIAYPLAALLLLPLRLARTLLPTRKAHTTGNSYNSSNSSSGSSTFSLSHLRRRLCPACSMARISCSSCSLPADTWQQQQQQQQAIPSSSQWKKNDLLINQVNRRSAAS